MYRKIDDMTDEEIKFIRFLFPDEVSLNCIKYDQRSIAKYLKISFNLIQKIIKYKLKQEIIITDYEGIFDDMRKIENKIVKKLWGNDELDSTR